MKRSTIALALFALLALLSTAKASWNKCRGGCSAQTRLHRQWCHPRFCALKPCFYRRHGRVHKAFRCVAHNKRVEKTRVVPRAPCGNSRRCARYAWLRPRCSSRHCSLVRCGRSRAFRCVPNAKKTPVKSGGCENRCRAGWASVNAACDRRRCDVKRCGGRRGRTYACVPVRGARVAKRQAKKTRVVKKTYVAKKKHTVKKTESGPCADKCFSRQSWASARCDSRHCAVSRCVYPQRGYKCAPRDEAVPLDGEASGGHFDDVTTYGGHGGRPSPSPYPFCVDICGMASHVSQACNSMYCKTMPCSDKWFQNGLKCVSK